MVYLQCGYIPIKIITVSAHGYRELLQRIFYLLFGGVTKQILFAFNTYIWLTQPVSHTKIPQYKRPLLFRVLSFHHLLINTNTTLSWKCIKDGTVASVTSLLIIPPRIMSRRSVLIKVFSILAILHCFIVLCRAECDITKCGVPKHYREIGCEPVEYSADDKERCCPIKYNCDEIKKQDATKCHYRGKTFADGEKMEEEVNCRAGCYCNKGKFTCGHVECPELVFNRPEPHCVIQNSREKCCSEKIICDEKEIENLHTCHMDDKAYRKGQLMYPANERCFTCLCDEKFDNSTVITKNSNCAEVDCAIDLSRLSEIRSGCVPVYYGEPTCCPISSKCRKLSPCRLNRFWLK